MHMSADQMKKFPRFARYVRNRMPEVQEVKPIIEAIRKLSGNVSRATIKKSLRWGQSPMIKVVKNLGADGEFTFGASSQEIRIDEDRVKDFEKGMSDKRGRFKKHLGKTKRSGKLVYMVGVILLHELTHWADDQDGVDDPIAGDPSNEEGWAYEKKVYGGIQEPWKNT